MKEPLVYLVVGEPSGDALGAGLMRALKRISPGISFAGIGGEAMAHEGLATLFPYRELSLMGFLEVVPRIPSLLKRLREAAEDIAVKRPAAVVTIDSPGFTFRLAEMLRKNFATGGITRIHYVAPSVWAYKPQRARKTAKLFHALLTLFPFEPPYFEKEGLPAAFVGHPVLWQESKGDGAAFRMRHGIAADASILLLLPGSRAGEVKVHLPLFLEAAKALANTVPVILAGTEVEEFIRAQAGNAIIADIAEKDDAFAAASYALSKSGTVTLELAVAGVPMVIAHRINPVSAWILRRMALIRLISLINIAAKGEIVPELLQERCTLPEILRAMKAVMAPGGAEKQKIACRDALDTLRGGNTEDPDTAAAKAVLKIIHSPAQK